MLRASPVFARIWSKRRTPMNASRRTSSVFLSPMTVSVFSTAQLSRSQSLRLTAT
jgi:hypothetical protein